MIYPFVCNMDNQRYQGVLGMSQVINGRRKENVGRDFRGTKGLLLPPSLSNPDAPTTYAEVEAIANGLADNITQISSLMADLEQQLTLLGISKADLAALNDHLNSATPHPGALTDWGSPGIIGNVAANIGWFTVLRLLSANQQFSTILTANSTNDRVIHFPDLNGSVLLHEGTAPSAWMFNHFLGSAGLFIYSTASGGTVAATTNTSSGEMRISSGTNTNGRAAIRGNFGSIRLGQTTGRQIDFFCSRHYIGQIQSPTNCAPIRWGFMNSETNPTTGVWIEYNEAQSNAIRCVAANNSNFTIVPTFVAVDSNEINVNRIYQIVITTGGEKAQFYRDGSLLNEITTNIPITSGREVTPIVSINRAAGASNYHCTFDYVGGGVRQLLNL
jgi:hypothetical protein